MDGGTDEKRMRLRYAGGCRVCGVQLPAGAVAIYERTTKTVRCISHDASTRLSPLPWECASLLRWEGLSLVRWEGLSLLRWECSSPLSWTSLSPAPREHQRVASSSGARRSVKNASGPSTRNWAA